MEIQRGPLFPASAEPCRESPGGPLNETNVNQPTLNASLSRNLEVSQLPPAGSEFTFLQVAESIGEIFILMEIESGEARMLYMSQAVERVTGHASSHFCACQGSWFDVIHPEDRLHMRETVLRSRLNQGYDEEYRVIRPDGAVRWVRERAKTVAEPAPGVLRLAAVLEDVTERKSIAKFVLEMDDQERFRIGQDLHDGICQQLVSIAFTMDSLWKNLKSRTPEEAYRASKILALLDGAIFQTRNLSQALYPVNLGGGGLATALRALGETVQHSGNVSFIAECSDAVLVHSGTLAMHVYRVAQEAIHNSLHHSCPSQIVVRLFQSGTELSLEIMDNGLLWDQESQLAYENGLDAIRFRTRLVGGNFQVSRKVPGATLMRWTFENPSPAGVLRAPASSVIDTVSSEGTRNH